MDIRIATHTLIRAAERGASQEEIERAISEGTRQPAKGDRQSSSLIIDFDSFRNGKYYKEKKIEVIFVQEGESIITITVYVFYGKFNKI